jgi:hypothetical protein
MIQHARNGSPVRRGLICLVLAAGAVGGCAWPNLRGPSFKDEPKIGRSSSPRTASAGGGNMFGFSTKAQQIERNLGVE